MLVLLLFDVGENKSLIINEFFNFGHLPLFGTASLVFLWVLNERAWPVREKKLYVITFFVAVIFGVATEFLQILMPGRDFEISDMVHDGIGALTFLIIAYPMKGRPRGRLMKLKVLSLLVIFLVAAPFYLALFQTWEMHRDFPLIGSFETRWEKNRWDAESASLALSQAHATQGTHSLEARLSSGIYPGIALKRFCGDWRGYDAFSFDVFLEGDTPLAITVRINDSTHDQTFKDRFNKRFGLVPGSNHVVIDCAEVRNAPHGRIMDMVHITDVIIFSYQLPEPRTLYFDNFRLERSKKSQG
jgi:hypothetical protein